MKQHMVEILLVEDNMQDAEFIIRHLKKHNLANNLMHLKDGEEALAFIFGTGQYLGQNHAKSPRLVLLDLHLPKMDGLQVLEKITSNPATQMIPVVMLTSSAQDPDIQKSYALGANSHIVKPIAFDGFAAAIKNIGFHWLLLNQAPH